MLNYTCYNIFVGGDNMNNKNNNVDWYNDVGKIIDLIIILISVILILSQSFAINHNLSGYDIFRSLLNHNITYLIVISYFICLKFKFGKKYFNYLNLFLLLIYFLISVASLLTIFQSFSLISIISFLFHGILFVYMFHSLLIDTRIWKDFKLDLSPFNDISNENYFYSIVLVGVVFLLVNLIDASTFDSAVLAIFDYLFYVLISRYIYLYGVYLTNRKVKEVRK